MGHPQNLRRTGNCTALRADHWLLVLTLKPSFRAEWRPVLLVPFLGTRRHDVEESLSVFRPDASDIRLDATIRLAQSAQARVPVLLRTEPRGALALNRRGEEGSREVVAPGFADIERDGVRQICGFGCWRVARRVEPLEAILLGLQQELAEA